MATTTISAYADDLELSRPPLYGPLKTNRQEGRVRTANFKLTLASEASGTSFAVAKLPAGARILRGTLAASATLANSATLAVGLAAVDGTGVIHPLTAGGYDTTDTAVAADVSDGTALLKAAATQGTTQVPFAITRALGYLYETQKEVWLTLTTGTGSVTTEIVFGNIDYVVD